MEVIGCGCQGHVVYVFSELNGYLTHYRKENLMMRRFLLSTLLMLTPLCIASLSIGQNVDDAACQATIQTNCTKCHTTDRICHELSESHTNWPLIIKEMGEKGKLSQDVQDTVLNCLTKASEPGKFVCAK